ncbi:MAG: preprotein translocase subunit SecE [Firmicutes bacterium]|jgi:preprotein translocase subunit SecE|nr:preprotein translocase subunit SecE [Bacillota bacterium]MBQ2270934.1 preprotein translocase subunit SecE [Bacillota bacterium]MBQ5797028.1 preprotein translocase subunit SecE [Bacillota bacterium]MBR5000906.1 preprotein translocase subunit SecE [Bacillota bacterium]
MADKNVAAKKPSFWKGVRTELKKVVWPTKKELKNYTMVVVLVCCAFALGFWVLDTVFLKLLEMVIGVTL